MMSSGEGEEEEEGGKRGVRQQCRSPRSVACMGNRELVVEERGRQNIRGISSAGLEAEMEERSQLLLFEAETAPHSLHVKHSNWEAS